MADKPIHLLVINISTSSRSLSNGGRPEFIAPLSTSDDIIRKSPKEIRASRFATTNCNHSTEPIRYRRRAAIQYKKSPAVSNRFHCVFKMAD